MNMTTLKDLFEHELQDLYDAEKQIIDSLPRLVEKTDHQELKNALNQYLDISKNHAQTVSDVANEIKIKHEEVSCKGMAGLIEEGNEMVDMSTAESVRDAAIITAVQRMGHYKISGYGSLVAHAHELGIKGRSDKLTSNLGEEYENDSNLTDIAERRINEEANSESSQLYA